MATLKYQLWSDEGIKEIKRDISRQSEAGRIIGDQIMGLIEEANYRHNTAMLEKDVEYLKRLDNGK